MTRKSQLIHKNQNKTIQKKKDHSLLYLDISESMKKLKKTDQKSQEILRNQSLKRVKSLIKKTQTKKQIQMDPKAFTIKMDSLS